MRFWLGINNFPCFRYKPSVTSVILKKIVEGRMLNRGSSSYLFSLVLVVELSSRGMYVDEECLV